MLINNLSSQISLIWKQMLIVSEHSLRAGSQLLVYYFAVLLGCNLHIKAALVKKI